MIEDKIAQMEKQIATQFKSWLNSPTVKVVVSLLPPSEHTEQILFAAFSSGFHQGGVLTILDLMQSNGANHRG